MKLDLTESESEQYVRFLATVMVGGLIAEGPVWDANDEKGARTSLMKMGQAAERGLLSLCKTPEDDEEIKKIVESVIERVAGIAKEKHNVEAQTTGTCGRTDC